MRNGGEMNTLIFCLFISMLSCSVFTCLIAKKIADKPQPKVVFTGGVTLEGAVFASDMDIMLEALKKEPEKKTPLIMEFNNKPVIGKGFHLKEPK
jgi:hypothetical protein